MVISLSFILLPDPTGWGGLRTEARILARNPPLMGIVPTARIRGIA
jgi:hypothetical protein